MAKEANWEELIRSERIGAEFFKDSMVGLAIFDERFYYEMVNPYLAASNGTPIESHMGKHVREILGSVSRPVERAIQQVFATGQPVLNCEVAGHCRPNRAEATGLTAFSPSQTRVEG